MHDDSRRQSVLFPDLLKRPVHAGFDEPDTTSDGGALLLKALDDRVGLTASVAGAIIDRRQPGKVRHATEELVQQRVFGLACGYEDANDAARLGHDPLHKLLLGRDPVEGAALASQPTLSRFESGFSGPELFRMGSALADAVLRYHRDRLGRGVRRITVDLDPTDDPAHGRQQGVLFNGFYDNWCYLPLLAFVRFADEPEQYLVTALLRPGRAHPTAGARCLLRHLLGRLRILFPKARILVRLDGGFLSPAMLGFLEGQPKVDFVVGLPQNAVLLRTIEPWMLEAIATSHRSGASEAYFTDFDYAARSWQGFARRVVAKAEVVRLDDRAPRSNPRFVVTNLRHRADRVYTIYCGRGEIENRIKELKHDLALDRTSCQAFAANQLRLLLTTAAFALLQILRRPLPERPRVQTLRLWLLKIGARVECSVRRVVVHLAQNHPWRDLWRRTALALGAAST
jgi:hypothetical protein